jgi:hypothetical protein
MTVTVASFSCSSPTQELEEQGGKKRTRHNKDEDRISFTVSLLATVNPWPRREGEGKDHNVTTIHTLLLRIG